MNETEVRRWFGEYLDVFAAAGRGERESRDLLAYYGAPLLMSSDNAFIALLTDSELLAAVDQQLADVRAAGYDHSEVLAFDVTVLNAASALLQGEFSRRRADESEIGRLTVTYLVTNTPVGRRIAAMALHS
jgi:hypothetical protein